MTGVEHNWTVQQQHTGHTGNWEETGWHIDQLLQRLWKDNSLPSIKVIPRFLWSPDVPYHIHSGTPFVCMLNQTNTVHVLVPYLFKTILILYSIYSQVSQHRPYMNFSSSTYLPGPTHVNHADLMSCRNHFVPHYAVFSILNNSISTIFSDTLSLFSSRNVTDPSSTPT